MERWPHHDENPRTEAQIARRLGEPLTTIHSRLENMRDRLERTINVELRGPGAKRLLVEHVIRTNIVRVEHLALLPEGRP